MRMPSVCDTRRAVRKLSSSETAMISSYSSGCHASGRSPRPRPRRGRAARAAGEHRSSGSAATILMSGFCALRYRAVPVIVPHVPAPATKWVIRPAVWRHSSGPVVSSWARGLAGLAYWLGRNAASSSVSRAATE